MKNSVLLIGLDGTSWGLLKPWINERKLPTFSRLLKEGTEGDLKSTIPPLSCSVWTSLFTGKNPGKHGIYEYITDSGELVNGSFIKTEKIWQILSYYNKRCCVVNVPMTYPVEKINGYMVSSFLTPSQEVYSYPPELMSLLKKNDYKIRIRYGKHKHLPNQKYIVDMRDVLLEKLYALLEKRYRTLKELMNEQWDFFMVVFGQEIAMLHHLFFDRKNIMLEFFRKVDYYIDDLIKTFSIKNTQPYIFIVSDHGFSASPTRSFNMGAWLEKNQISKDDRSLLYKIVPKVYRKLNSRIPLSKLILQFNKTKKVREVFQRDLTKSSNVYYKYPGLYIKQGELKMDDYEKLRDKLIQELRRIQDPLTDEKVFQIVEKRESIFSGSYSKYFPDVVALPKSNFHIIFSYDSNKLFDDLKLYLKAKHFSDVYGIFLVHGKDIKEGTINDASILDIFPTVLHILDAPLLENLDGKILKDIFKENSYLLNKEIIYSKEDVRTLQEKSTIQESIQNIKI